MSATRKYKIGVIGLHMGAQWATAAGKNPRAELAVVYDKDKETCSSKAEMFSARPADSEEDFFSSDIDVAIVATPDHFHRANSIAALSRGKHVICEKPLAPTVRECREIIKAVKKYGKFFMVGQVCRYAPGFKMAKSLIEDGAIGEPAFIESEYAHDYAHAPGVDNWRKDPKIKREGFIGGGCHALDLVRWLAGDPCEVFCYTNRKLLKDWPTDDTGVAVLKFRDNLIGKVFVSVGVKRQYTMRTVICGTAGTIICDNTSPAIRLYKDKYLECSKTNKFWDIPVNVASHNVAEELNEFIGCLEKNKQINTDVYEGTNTVALGEAALKSARTGKPVRINYIATGRGKNV